MRLRLSQRPGRCLRQLFVDAERERDGHEQHNVDAPHHHYIAIGDAGRSGPAVGCGDSAVATFTGAVRHTDAVAPTVQALLANHEHYLGAAGLDNALWQSRLTYQSHTMRGTTILLHLSGSFRLGGVCDIPRVKAQLEYTAMRAAGASSAIVYIGSRTIDQVLSQK